MEGYQTDIQALLQDINGNYGDPQSEQPPLPYSRPGSNSYSSRVDQHMIPAHNLAPNRNHLPQYQYHRTAACSYNDTNLDAYDRAFLAEPQSYAQWQTDTAINTAPVGRLSLPGHTASSSITDTFRQHESQSTRRARPAPSPLRFGARITQYAPPSRVHLSSSPTDGLPSSPSLGVSQRRTNHEYRDNDACINSSSAKNSHPLQIPSKALQRAHQLYQNTSGSPSRPQQVRVQPQIELDHAPPVVQGIRLVSLNEMPDRLRSVFHHQLFNAIQSKCFAIAYKSDDNLVVSAPTGGGKTAILEMAICRLVSGFMNDQFKIVYMAPTKSLCSERQRDWQAKFATLNLVCAELTGDTDHGQLRNVQSASIIITTPEKWDSMTRKWNDHAKLMRMVKLFLIDEVHILKDSRGATLEAVVSRMKSVGSNVRFVALSATVPNSEDIAAWLGKDANNQHLPAPREKFGEEFRPVRLQKHVVGLPYRGNDFGFESACDPQLPKIIARYCHKKPIMVFCITRKSTVSTAKLLANLWASKGPRDRYWEGPTRRLNVQDPELKNTLTSGVAFHHAGLDSSDRHLVEQGFLEAQVNVICCTSTLAVGVNLPCHMVIIKNTVSYQDDGIKEYADLEIMQMLGRAGRPQFDTTAVAVIITKQEKVKKYELLVSGAELLESCLHVNLIDHLNAEIGLGTIHDLHTAKKWLAGTFLYVRLAKNPGHYKLDGDAVGQNLDDRIERICKRDLSLLEDTKLVSSDGKLMATEFGDAMARYYVKFETMRGFMRLEPRSKISDILSAVVQADEFRDIRLRAGEKKLYKAVNRGNGIRFPIKVDLAMHEHKRTLILQSELGGVEFPTDEQYVKHKKQYNQDKAILFSHVHRLIRCIIDCQIHLQDAVTVRHALELARSFGARVWDNSPYQMKQIAQIGLVAIRKLTIGGINSIEALEGAEPHRIEMLMSKNPPFGSKLLANVKDFPKLRVSVKMMGKALQKGRAAAIKIKAECGFMNDKVPIMFHRMPIYVCLLTERSDGFLVDFRRISAKKLNNGQDILMTAEILSHSQYITCYVMCDGIAGTMRYAELKPQLPAHLIQPTAARLHNQQSEITELDRTLEVGSEQKTGMVHETLEEDEFDDHDFMDQDIVNAVEEMDFSHVDEFEPKSKGSTPWQSREKPETNRNERTSWNPEKLKNGKWACNHKCKDKTACKHLCCREGVDKAPKTHKNTFVSAASLVDASHSPPPKDLNGCALATKQSLISNTPRHGNIETIDLTNRQVSRAHEKNVPRELIKLNQLHDRTTKGRSATVNPQKKPSFDYTKGERPRLSFLVENSVSGLSSDKGSMGCDEDWIGGLPSPFALSGKQKDESSPFRQEISTNYGSSWHDGLPSPSVILRQDDQVSPVHVDSDSLEDFDLSQFNDDKSDVEAVMVGLSDSLNIQEASRAEGANTQTGLEKDDEAATLDTDNPNDLPFNIEHTGTSALQPGLLATSDAVGQEEKLFFSTDSPEKLVKPKGKREAPGAEEGYHSAPVPKRPRAMGRGDKTLLPSSSIENRISPPVARIKEGQPAWVYEFDPALIAEWQDIVEFV